MAPSSKFPLARVLVVFWKDYLTLFIMVKFPSLVGNLAPTLSDDNIGKSSILFKSLRYFFLDRFFGSSLRGDLIVFLVAARSSDISLLDRLEARTAEASERSSSDWLSDSS